MNVHHFLRLVAESAVAESVAPKLCLTLALAMGACKSDEAPVRPAPATTAVVPSPAPTPVPAPEAEPPQVPADAVPEPKHEVAGVPQHFYFAGLDEHGRVDATLWDLAPDAWDALSAAMETQTFEFAADSPVIAGYLRKSAWWGITGTRVVELQPHGFELVGGASDSSLAVSLVRKGAADDKAGSFDESSAPAMVMMGARPTFVETQWFEMPELNYPGAEDDGDEGEGDDGHEFEDEETGGSTQLVAAELVPKGLQAEIDAALAKAKAEGVKADDIGGVQVVYLKGKFSSAAKLAAVNVVMTRDEEEAFLSGLALLDTKGEVKGWAVKLDVRMDQVLLDGTVRFAPKGFTHVMYTLRYYEGAYTYMVVWEPDGWRDWSTGGDGA